MALASAYQSVPVTPLSSSLPTAPSSTPIASSWQRHSSENDPWPSWRQRLVSWAQVCLSALPTRPSWRRRFWHVQPHSSFSSAFGVEVKLNRNNMVQLRRMNEGTPEFPVHNDFTSNQESIASFLYLSPEWSESRGDVCICSNQRRIRRLLPRLSHCKIGSSRFKPSLPTGIQLRESPAGKGSALSRSGTWQLRGPFPKRSCWCCTS